LLVRPGARFACSGDGLCCTDLHALGPLTRAEVKLVKKLRPGSVIMHDEVEAPCMRTAENGGCSLLNADGWCRIHVEDGPEKKPGGCKRFPYGLVTTPYGGRITTESRCPCRTLGERPALDPADADRSLRDLAGRLESDLTADKRIPMTITKKISFEDYERIEADMIERLMRGERAEDVLACKPLPGMFDSSWPVWAAGFYELDDGTRGGVALAWFADTLLALCTGNTPPERPRPWAAPFERGAARAKKPATADEVINDWIADEIWMMRGLGFGCPFDVARAELATRLCVVRAVTSRLRAIGVRPDQAAAEAVMMGELAAACEHWDDVVEAIANDPSPADALTAS
jgi:hypothetical protein